MYWNVRQRAKRRCVLFAGAVAKKVLAKLGIKVAGHVIEIGGVQAKEITYSSIEELKSITEASPVRCLDEEAGNQMMKAIDDAKANGDSIGGIVEVIVEGCQLSR